jgi:hypothetical protein
VPTDKPAPVEPDWKALWERSEQTRRRSKRGQAFAIAAIVIGLALSAWGAVAYFSFRDVPGLQRKQSAILAQSVDQNAKSREILDALQQAEVQRACVSAKQGQAFATILDLLGNAFATPPAPDPDRLKVVQGFHDAAAAFRAAPAAATTACPG